MIATDVDLMFFKSKCFEFGLEKERLCDFFMCAQPIAVRHHWVHRRRQEGKCKQCGKVGSSWATI